MHFQLGCFAVALSHSMKYRFHLGRGDPLGIISHVVEDKIGFMRAMFVVLIVDHCNLGHVTAASPRIHTSLDGHETGGGHCGSILSQYLSTTARENVGACFDFKYCSQIRTCLVPCQYHRAGPVRNSPMMLRVDVIPGRGVGATASVKLTASYRSSLQALS